LKLKFKYKYFCIVNQATFDFGGKKKRPKQSNNMEDTTEENKKG